MSERNDAVRSVLELWRQLPEEHRSDFTISFSIIRGALGLEWMTRHLDPESSKTGFFRLSADAVTEDQATKHYRTIDLAESLINLKDIDGFPECISRMRSSENPESALAELHVAKMLHINQWQFRFATPQGHRGNDYDFEIEYCGHLVFGDAKCKVEATDLSSKTITSTLSSSRTQLPSKGPGVFFIKIPQHWTSDPNWERITIQGALDFFAQGSGRIVSVAFYLEPLHYAHGILMQGHIFKEVTNPHHRHDKGLDWRFFERWKPPSDKLNSMPPFWIRLSNFPSGLPGYDEAQSTM